MPIERRDGYWLWVGGPVPRGASAITVGRVVSVRRGRERSERLLRHEAEHVAQYRPLGVLGLPASLPGAYLGGGSAATATGRVPAHPVRGVGRVAGPARPRHRRRRSVGSAAHRLAAGSPPSRPLDPCLAGADDGRRASTTTAPSRHRPVRATAMADRWRASRRCGDGRRDAALVAAAMLVARRAPSAGYAVLRTPPAPATELTLPFAGAATGGSSAAPPAADHVDRAG